MPTPREGIGGLSEASRLLQEGLALLDSRIREVEVMVREAQERAREIILDAEDRARGITAEADSQRSDLEEQVAALRIELAALREELATPAPETRDGIQESVVTDAAEAIESESKSESEAHATDAAELQVATEVAGTPQWGRRSSSPAAPQAVRSRSSRSRWLPPWFPFVVVMLAAAALVADVLENQGSGRTVVAEQAQPTPTSIPAQAVFESALTISPAVAPTPAAAAQPTAAPALTSAPLPTALPSIPTRAPSSTSPSPDGPIVAAYTTYATYTVQPGDTLNRVATDFGASGEAIMRTSGLSDPNLLVPGQQLTIPRDTGWLYRVQANDTLEAIAVRFGLTPDDLVAASALPTSAVRPGDLLFIPNRAIAART